MAPHPNLLPRGEKEWVTLFQRERGYASFLRRAIEKSLMEIGLRGKDFRVEQLEIV
jgi:hypothetical protein